MLTSTEVKELPRRLCAYIPVRVRREDIRTVMWPGLQELFAELKAQGVSPAGPWFTHHPRMDPAYFDLEISIPVSAPLQPRGRVCMGEWPAMKAAVAVYAGPYEGLGAAWGEFKAWMATVPVTPGPGGLWECYLVGPDAAAEPSAFRTQLVQPVS